MDDDDSTIIAPIIRQTNVWYSSKKMELCVPIYLSSQKVKVLVLIDSSAGGVFIDSSFIRQMGFKVNDL